MLLEEEMCQNTRNEEDSAFSAETKKGKGKDFSNPSSLDDEKKKKKIKCFYCTNQGISKTSVRRSVQMRITV